MTRHLADHPRSNDGGRVKHFLRLSRETAGETQWAEAQRKPKAKADGQQDRRMVEYLRIDRGHSV